VNNVKEFLVYTDKPTDFEFNVEVEGASLKEAKARLILSGQKTYFLVEGTINSNGSATIEIPKLRTLVDEDAIGDMTLEVIVDDAYFQPWSGTYKVTASKKVTVNEVASSKDSGKPTMRVQVKETKSPYQHNVESIVENLQGQHITSKNILGKRNKKYLYSLIEHTFNKPLSALDTGVILNDIIHTMTER
jgi:hypothetical protein